MKRLKGLILTRFWLLGPVCGFTAAVLITLVFTAWDWSSNPGGIFRDQAGTNWQFVYETAISWFVPTFLYGTVLIGLLHLCASGVVRMKERLAKSDDQARG